jgi:SAM-dependent methyltransferase
MYHALKSALTLKVLFCLTNCTYYQRIGDADVAMTLYATYVFPRLMDWVMSGEAFQRLREDLLKDAQGEVLEIGYGTALNLPHYPTSVTRLALVDPARLLASKVQHRAAQAGFPVTIEQQRAEALPYSGRRFDTVVSTWTLCTIPDPEQALGEIRRVLKPDGLFLFLEHGRSDDARTAAWQDRLNPIQRFVACGCNLNRPIDRLITRSGLRIVRVQRFRMPRVPRVVGEMYQGQAASPGS